MGRGVGRTWARGLPGLRILYTLFPMVDAPGLREVAGEAKIIVASVGEECQRECVH